MARSTVFLGVAMASALLMSNCSSDTVSTIEEPTPSPAEDEATGSPIEFCEALDAAFLIQPAGDEADAAFEAALDLAPEELSATIEGIRSANEDEPTDDDLAHLSDLFAWRSTNCGSAEQTVRRIAPASPPEGFVSCGDLAAFPGAVGQDPEGSMIVYGDESLDDPYDGQVVTVVTGLLLGPGDAPSTGVEVDGLPAVTGPAGFFQGGGGPDMTRVVAWTVGGVEVTVVGRGFVEDQVDELVALAEQVEIVGETARLADTDLGVLYDGSLAPLVATAPFLPWGADYAVQYQRPDGLGILSVNGLSMTEEALQATRALFFESSDVTFHSNIGIVASWGDSGPFVAAWRESDGVVVWVVGLGVGRDETVAASEASTVLTDEQWRTTTKLSPECGGGS